MSVTVDLKQFNRTLNDYMAKTPKTLEEVINKKMYFVLKGAWERTPKVDRSTIEKDLNIIGYKVRRNRKTGKMSRGRMISGHASLLYLLVNARRGKSGRKGLYGRQMDAAARKLAAARFRAAGTARRGWLKPMLAFASRSKETVPGQALGKLPAGAGSAKIAQPGWNPVAEATYAVAIDKGKQIDPRVETALAASFAAEEASMRAYIEQKIQEDINAAMR